MTAKTTKTTKTTKAGKKPARKSTAKTGKGTSRAKGRKASAGRLWAGLDRRVLAAFAAGLLAAVLLLVGGYTLYTSQQRATPPPAASGASKSSGGTRQRAVTTQAEVVPSRPPAQSSGSQSAPDAPNASDVPGAPGTPGTDEAVQQALMDLQSLPYEETVGTSLEETVKQIDYALVQAVHRLGLPDAALRVSSSLERRHEGSSYIFQKVDVLPGASAEEFSRELEQDLRWWAEAAGLKRSGKDQLEIVVKGVTTHVISLYPGKKAFPEPQPETPSARLGPRLRVPGEEPRLTIVMDDLGENMGAVRRLLALNYPVTFAFWPHAGHVQEGAEAAHAAGREILVHMPMEPEGYPAVKPGPGVLLRNTSAGQIRLLTEQALARVPYAVGLNNHMGSRFTRDREGVRVVLEILRGRSLFMLDSLTHPRSVFYDEALQMNVRAYRRDVFLDNTISRQAILDNLRRAEETALLTGRAIAIGHPHPETLAALKEWERLRNPSVRIVRLRDLPR